MVWFQHIWHLFNPLPPPVVALGIFSGSSQLKGIFLLLFWKLFRPQYKTIWKQLPNVKVPISDPM